MADGARQRIPRVRKDYAREEVAVFGRPCNLFCTGSWRPFLWEEVVRITGRCVPEIPLWCFCECPTGSELFKRSGRIECPIYCVKDLEMPDLRRPSPASPINLSVDDQPAADAAADGDVEDRR